MEYAVRLETGPLKLAANIFKMTLNIIEKILSVEDDRYPKLCF